MRTILLLLLFGPILWIGPSFSKAQEAPKKSIKIGFAFLETIDDQGWSAAHWRGALELKAALGDAVHIAHNERVVSPAEAERVFRGYGEAGFDLVFGTTFGHMEPMLKVAKDFPKTIFEHCSGFKTAPNMGNYFARMEQAEFLAGLLAGLMGKHRVGTVATQPLPELVRGINAFTLGLAKGLAEAGRPHDPDKLNTVAWLKAWRDPVNETLMAETLIAKGADLVRQTADTPDSAKAACLKNIPGIGYGEDAAKYGADCALVSTLWNFGPIYIEKARQVLENRWTPESLYWGFEHNAVALSDFHPSVPESVRRRVDALKLDMTQGRDDSFLGPVYDQTGQLLVQPNQRPTDHDLLSMRRFVRGVVGKVPEN